MSKPPKYSVIVPTHRRANYLARALSSLKCQIDTAQLEIIVISDCIDAETDITCQKLLTNTDTYIRRSGANGPSASRNIGLQIAKGQFILFLDDDDAWHDGLLLALNSCNILQSGNPIYFDSTVIKESRPSSGPIFIKETAVSMAGRLTEDVYVKNQVHMSCFAFPAHLLANTEFDVHMRAYEDWDFLLSIFDKKMPVHVPILGSKIYEVDDATTDRRGSSAEANNQHAILDYLYVYRRHQVRSVLQDKRAALLKSVNLNLPPHVL
jgi:GalNAc5-diNAcBac-PP-undecaprenol beta-1,3-glucosyltransferase